MSNYPAGVNDDHPHFTDGDSADYPEDEAGWRARQDRKRPKEPEHPQGCKRMECDLDWLNSEIAGAVRDDYDPCV